MRGKQYDVKLSYDEKVEWFKRHIEERKRVKWFESEEEALEFLRSLRKLFVQTYGRDVTGYFFRKLCKACGLGNQVSPRTQEKMDWAFKLMDDNANYRTNKTDLARALEKQFGEKTLPGIVNDIFDEWRERKDHPQSKIDLDIHGQEALFPDM